MKKFICFSIVAMLLAVMFCPMTVSADVPYKSYNYDYWGDIVPSPVSYEPLISVSTAGTEAGAMNLPSDMAIADNGDIYITDSGNNRIVILNKDLKYKKVISEFQNEGKADTFKNPSGITIGNDGTIHIADTDNNRIVSLKPSGELVRAFGVQKNSLTDENFVFIPSRIAVDGANRYYVVAKNVFEGMMCFDEDGSFFGYFGTIKIQSNIADKFWKLIATDAQKSKMQLFIPTEFTSLDIDKDGFVYGTNVDYQDEQTIRKLNPSGKDVLVNYNENKKIMGDLEYRLAGTLSGPTSFIDIIAKDKGIYSALDATRGRIFTYDSEGNLLYIFGGLGSELGMFKKPVAIDYYENHIYVLDQTRGELVQFAPTRYGELINTAIGLRYDGAESEAVQYWEEVLKLDSNYELAYSGIGKSLLAANDNKEAVKYLKKGMNKRYYSVAFKRYRNEVLKKYSNLIFGGITILILVIIGVKVYKFIIGRKYRH